MNASSPPNSSGFPDRMLFFPEPPPQKTLIPTLAQATVGPEAH